MNLYCDLPITTSSGSVMELDFDRCRFSHASGVMRAKDDIFFALPSIVTVLELACPRWLLLVSHTASTSHRSQCDPSVLREGAHEACDTGYKIN